MENKDRLDEFMQRKFAEDEPENRIVFQEDYWLQAEALLEAGQRRRRRRFLWWLFTGGLGALLLLFWIFINPLDRENKISTAQQLRSGRDTTATTVRSEARPVSGPENTAATRTGEQPEHGIEPVVKTGQVRATRTATPAKNTTETGNKPVSTYSVLPGNDPHDTGKPVRTSTDAPGKSPKIARIQPGQQAMPVAHPAINSGQTAKQPSTEPAAIQTLTENLPDPAPVTPGGAGSAKPGNKPATPAAASPVRSFDRLPLVWPLLRLPARPFPGVRKNAPPPPVAVTEPHRDWEWQAGLTAGLSTPVGHLEKEGAGTTGGLTLRIKRKGSPLSYNAGLGWRWRSGQFPDAVELPGSETLRYSFGYIQNSTIQRASGSHWLELPLYAQYHWNRLNVALGVMPTLLLYFQGKELNYRQTSLEPTPVETGSRSIHIDNEYLHQFRASAFAGMGWQPVNRLGIDFRVHYQPATKPVNPDVPLGNSHRVWAELGLRYFLITPK